MSSSTSAARPPINPYLKLTLEIGPLVLFFAANARFGIFAGTAVFMAAVLIALGASYSLTRRLPIMPLVSAVIVVVFGSLTLVLHDATFIKIKPTLIYALFAAVLFGGFVANKPLLATLFDQVFNLSAEGWRKLTLRWAVFFIVMAVLNEIVWRTQTTNFWVDFKLFGFVPLTFLFGAMQYPLLQKYDASGEAAKE